MTLARWTAVYWCLIVGLVAAIAFFRAMMPVMVRFPNLPKPQMRLKVPEKPKHCKPLKMQAENPWMDEQIT